MTTYWTTSARRSSSATAGAGRRRRLRRPRQNIRQGPQEQRRVSTRRGRAKPAPKSVEKVANGVNEAERGLKNAGLTAKIKSKMALDDSVTARNIDVDTDETVVTLSGTVRSAAEHARAAACARLEA